MKIAAFNVQTLGMKKVTDEVLLKNLIKIVSRYSVVVLLEVRDQSGEAMEIFCTELNKRNPYTMVCSESLGRSTYREKFVYFYREAEVTMIDSYQYIEEDSLDVLVREPFILMFQCPSTVVQKVVLIPVHTKPEDADIELDALHEVVEAVRRKWKNNNIMILGDFNADGRYLTAAKKRKIRLWSAPYHWLIGDEVDTTISDSTDHTYDRIVVYGDRMKKAVVPNSAQPFNFRAAFRLSWVIAEEISDHYPVEVELKEY